MNSKIKIYINTKITIHINTKIRSTYRIRQKTDEDNYACRIIADFQKAFVTVDHHILLKKLECHGVRQISSNFFTSCLCYRRQFLSLNECNSNLHDVKCWIPQASILQPPLFLLYINHLI